MMQPALLAHTIPAARVAVVAPVGVVRAPHTARASAGVGAAKALATPATVQLR